MAPYNLSVSLKYQKDTSEEEPGTMEKNFSVSGVAVKCKIPSYESESEEAFLTILREFTVMLESYNF